MGSLLIVQETKHIPEISGWGKNDISEKYFFLYTL